MRQRPCTHAGRSWWCTQNVRSCAMPLPRRLLSYTAGKGNPHTEEMEAARERKWRELRQTLPGLLAFAAILLLALLMLLMLLAEFRGFYLDQIIEMLRPG